MERTILETENGLVVELPNELLEAYDLRGGSRVRVILDAEHGGILIAPVESAVEAFDALVNEAIEKYRPALEALAKR